MEIKLFNSLTNEIENFVPLKKGEVSIYTCGPTVYDYVHIGNLRPVVVFDVLRNLFEYLGYKVIFVSNYTDIDDKIINKALSEGVSEEVISNRYIKAYEENVKELNANVPTVTPRVSESIEEIIDFISVLIKKGGAYENDGEVFFDVTKDSNYGELSHVNPDELEHGSRVEENAKKKHPGDFLLWKKTSEGITFSSPWGEGRPGWHTECVVMINKTFNKPLIDIHGGGFDLKFPHHENEIAQSRIYGGTHLANYWMHNGFINVNNEKMSKSLGNTLTGNDFINKYGGNVLRLLLLSSHYRAPLNVTEEVIESSEKSLERIENSVRQLGVFLRLRKLDEIAKEAQIAEFIAQLADDLNTSNALTVLFAKVKEINMALRAREKDIDLLQQHYVDVMEMLNILGIKIDIPEIDENDIQLYKEYIEAKQSHNFEKSDKLRILLTERKIL
ncbi:MAG: cysteine--tRNA ligase [Bacilli bacterium]|jgi:cysteinyl-tRNA synthetase